MTDTTGLLSVADVARLRGHDHSTAWRLLRTLEREHGAKLVREGRTMYIAPNELREGLARMPPVGMTQLHRELSSLRRRVSYVEAELKEFRRLSHDWLKRQSHCG